MNKATLVPNTELKQSLPQFVVDIKVIFLTLVLISILASALYVRFNTFWLPHWRGDQSHYITLAMKLDKHGFKEYNLRGTRIYFVDILKKPEIRMTAVNDANLGNPGDLIRILQFIGQPFYDEPLHMRAPLLPIALMISHKIFTQQNQPYLVLSSDIGSRVERISPRAVLEGQYWAAIVPLFFNLGVIFLTCLLGWSWFREKRIGIYAALIMSLNPISIWLAHKILTEDITLFFVLVSFYFFNRYFPRANAIGCYLAGISGGLAVLANQRAGLILVVVGLFIFVYQFHAWKQKISIPKAVGKALLDKMTLIYTLGLFSASGWWFVKVWMTYGHPLHTASVGSAIANRTDITGWFQAVAGRPHPLLLFSLGIVFFSPLFGLAYMTLGKFYRGVVHGLSDVKTQGFVFCWIWICVFFIYFSEPWHSFNIGNKEHRYFYVVYPAIALMSAYGLNQIRVFFNSRLKNPVIGAFVVLTFFGLYAWRTIPLAMERVFSPSMLF